VSRAIKLPNDLGIDTFRCFGDYNYVRPDDAKAGPNCRLEVGEQYAMRVDGSRWVRVMCLTPEETNENGECRAHVVVLEENPFVKAGSECKPLAFTLSALPK
jgi:hypothetical protein